MTEEERITSMRESFERLNPGKSFDELALWGRENPYFNTPERVKAFDDADAMMDDLFGLYVAEEIGGLNKDLEFRKARIKFVEAMFNALMHERGEVDFSNWDVSDD